jgi:hypothetical protein
MADRSVKDIVRDIKAGKIKDMSALVPCFHVGNRTMSLEDRMPFKPLFTLNQPRYMTYMCGRQVSKSFSMCMTNILKPGMVDNLTSVIVEPRFDQKKRINSQILVPLLKGFELYSQIMDPKGAESLEIKKFRNSNDLLLIHAFASVDGARGISGAGSVAFDELQDFNPEFVPIIESTMAAHETFGLTSFFGSAKTEDDALGDAFQNSSQGHWCIPCDCGHFNIAAPDQDLHKMIGKEGLVCSKCGRHLYTRKGYFLHAFPSRRTYHAGYHVPQIVLPFHCERPHKWADILYEQQKWGQTEFYNEVLGIPVDASTRLLSLKELLAARNYCDNSLEHAIQVSKDYNIIVVGVDWSGGGGGKSRTAIAVLGRRYGSIKTDCLYLHYLRQGMTLDEEANEVAKVVNAVQADYIAHDYTGAGFQREHILYAQHPYLRELNYPVSLAHKPTSQLITYSNNGSRNTYVADRTRCLLMLFTSIKSKQFTVPMFDPKDELAPQLELLNEIEKPQTLESNSNVYLLQKVASKWDDCCFACAIGNLCICDVTKAYPDFAIDTKYSMTPDQIEDVYGPEVPIEW